MAKRADANQPEIVEALRAAGASVQHTHEIGRGCPDLAVGFRGQNYWLEVKTPYTMNDLTDDELRWHMNWRGNVYVVGTVDEALRAIGAL